MKLILSVLLLIPIMIFAQQPLTEAKPEISKEKVYEEVDQEASFPGGADEMVKYIGKMVEYPKTSMEKGEEGKVFVEFVVNPDGAISEIKVLKGVSRDLDVEATRVVKNMPKWIPAEVDGKKVRSYARLPINFALSE